MSESSQASPPFPPLVLAYTGTAPKAAVSPWRKRIMVAYAGLAFVAVMVTVDVRQAVTRDCRERNELREPVRAALGYAVTLSIDAARSEAQKAEARRRGEEMGSFYANELRKERC